MGSSSSTSLIKELHKDLANGIQYQASNLPKKNKLSKFFEKLDQDKNQALSKDEIAKFLDDLFYYVWKKVGTKRMAPFLVTNGKVSYYIAQPFTVPPTIGKRERGLALIFQFMDMNDDNEIDRGEFIDGLQKLLVNVLLEPVFEEYQVESSSHKYSVNDEPPVFKKCYNGSIPIVDEENLTLLNNGQELVQVSEEEAKEYHRNSQEQDWSQLNQQMNFDQIKKAQITNIEKSQIPFELCKLFRSVEKSSTPEQTQVNKYIDLLHGSKSKKWVVVVEDSIGKELSNIALTVKKGEVFRLFNDFGYFWFIGLDKTFTFRKGIVSRDILKEISQSEAEAIMNKTNK